MITDIIWSSVYEFNGSRLNLNVFSNKTGSCGITVSRSLRSDKPMLDISIPSILIHPLKLSIILHNTSPKVDFPAPVLPTMPILLPDFILRLIESRTISVSGLYLAEKLENSICP